MQDACFVFFFFFGILLTENILVCGDTLFTASSCSAGFYLLIFYPSYWSVAAIMLFFVFVCHGQTIKQLVTVILF